MIKKIIAIYLAFAAPTQCTPQVFAQTNMPNQNPTRDEASKFQKQPSSNPAPKPSPTSTGDIDMNQFRGLQEDEARQQKAPENRVRITTTCQDEHGSMIKKGESGFETCISNSQSRVLKQSANPEAPDDVRKR